ncbi:MAG: MFS transporter [Gammaproteobacteria bacterium]|nr:MFS transporter [Gammaproteobacteria bacterium]
MWGAISSCWALLLGLGVLMMGHGLQGTLLGVRAAAEEFPTEITGLVMTGYFAGFVLGSVLVPRLVKNVGHVRVFAALASLASVAVLSHSVFVYPLFWFAMRFLTGFCFAGLYIVAESWINDVATNKTRATLLSVYMVIVMGAMAASQLLLNLADPRSFELFVLVSVLVSLALVPMLLSVAKAPEFSTPSAVSLRGLYAITPFGVVGALATGLTQGSVFGMGAVYAVDVGLTVSQISWFMTAIFLGSVLLQWPMGLLADRYDRRSVIIILSTLAGLLAALCSHFGERSLTTLLALALLYGGLSMPLYAMFIAYTNDYIQPSERVAASAGLVLIGGLGAVLGPLSCALVMGQLGNGAFFLFLFAVHSMVAMFGLYRSTRREAPPLDEQVHFPALGPRGSAVVVAMATEEVRE